MKSVFFGSWKTVARLLVSQRIFLCVCLEGIQKLPPGERAEQLEHGFSEFLCHQALCYECVNFYIVTFADLYGVSSDLQSVLKSMFTYFCSLRIITPEGIL